MKIGTIDGLSFEKSRSHQVMSMKGGYNNLRSHGYAILKLCDALGVRELKCSTDTGDTGTELNPADDLAYTLKDPEFSYMRFGECKHNEYSKYGILVQTLVDEKYIQRLYDFVQSVDHLYIYSSDYEYEVRKNTYGLKFLFEWMRTTVDHKPLVEMIKSKLVVAYCGWYHIARITPAILGIKCEFFPQVINPNLTTLCVHAEKVYDGFLMGMNDSVVDFMKMSDKTYLSIQYRDYTVPHTEFRNVTQILQSGTSTDIYTLIQMSRLCRYHCITNSWKTLYPSLLQNSDMFVNQTFKIFEAYYGDMLPINPAMNWEAAHVIMNSGPVEYHLMKSAFRKQMKDNYSFIKFKHLITENLR